MKMRLKKLIIDNFKGVTHKEYNIDSLLVRIFSMNGKGKSTIKTAYFWLFHDKDCELKSNPAVRPIGVEECIPTVTAIVDIDGKEYAFAKMQKQRVSKPDDFGISKITLTNTYEVNSVPKAERDFKAYLEEKGVQLDNFLVCSHPDVFTGQKQADMRSVLFKMASEKNDYDIASFMDEAERKYASLSDAEASLTTVDEIAEEISPTWDVALLLKSYTLHEIEAMNKASKKKAEEQVEAIPNQIVGLESAKVDIDVAELNLAKNALNEQIFELDSKISNASKVFDDLGQKELRLKFDINAQIENANKDLLKERTELSSKIADIEFSISKAKSELERCRGKIKAQSEIMKDSEKRRVELAEKWKEVNSQAFDETPYLFDESKWKFDESDTVCSLCGQTLPSGEIEQKRAEFERRKGIAMQAAETKLNDARKEFGEDKKQQLSIVEKSGEECKNAIVKANEEINGLQSVWTLLENELGEYERELTTSKEKLASLPERVDLSENPVYIDLTTRLSKIQKEIEQLRDSDSVTDGLKAEKVKLQAELQTVHEQLGKASNNTVIDEQISDLREKQRDYEQKKADAEKILHQLSLVSKRKNSLLVDEINHHFSVVKWKLFDYAKNGEYKEVCVPYVEIGGKELEFNDSMNTGLKIRAKLDICNSFQKFFGMNIPVFLDNAESINDFNLPVLLDTQLITLSVSEDKELRIEVAECNS